MPIIHTRTFRVRYYECDAHGHLNNANYLRYMQETAFDASAAGGYDLTMYANMHRLWLIRESGIEFIQPLFYNDLIAVKTWISDFRRVTSRRLYEFTKKDQLKPVARAYTDWAFIDTINQRPAAIPEDLMRAFFPEGVPGVFPRREPFHQVPTPPPNAYSTTAKVSFQDIDGMLHVNNAVYLHYLNQAGMQALAHYHWPWDRMQDEGRAIFIRNIQIQYLQPALLNDQLEISTWLSDIRRATLQRHYKIERSTDQALIAQARTYSVWVDLKTGAPVRFPKGFLNDISPLVSDDHE